MAVIRWQPWYEMETLRHQLDQLFTELDPTQQAHAPTADWTTWVPLVELRVTDAEVVLRVALPGIDGKDLDIQVSREAVVISGEYKPIAAEAGRVVRSEFRYGRFRRVVPLPFAVQNDQVSADLSNGILTLTLPKRLSDRPQPVKLNSTAAAAPTQEHHAAKAEPADVWA